MLEGCSGVFENRPITMRHVRRGTVRGAARPVAVAARLGPRRRRGRRCRFLSRRGGVARVRCAVGAASFYCTSLF